MKKNMFKLLVYDLKHSFNQRIVRICILLLFTTLLYAITLDNFRYKQHNSDIINFMYGVDYVSTDLNNYSNELVSSDNNLNILILINSLFLFTFIDYYKSSFNKSGIFIFTRIKKDKFYILKTISMFLNISILYIIIFLIFISFSIGNSIPYMTEISSVALLNILTTFTILLLYNSVNLFFNNKIALSIAVFSIVGTTKFNTPLLIMQHSIVARHVPYSKFETLTNIKSYIYILMYLIIIITLTYYNINNVGIFKGEINGNFKGK